LRHRLKEAWAASILAMPTFGGPVRLPTPPRFFSFFKMGY